nr:replication protein A 70 kDa DNA-binding subunit-like [Drosophila takahashii]XP_017007616.2 replication protein A 70 kDa DNA-binding subunit-like [Drosophila takahashii]
MDPIEITPISRLALARCHSSPIRARVTWKSEISEWNSDHLNGSILLMNLLDNSGEITVVLFNEQCKKFDRQIFTGSEYNFINFEVRQTDTDFKILSSPFQIYFIDSTIVQLRDRTRDNFLPLKEVPKVPDNEPVDTIGICSEVRKAKYRGGHLIREILLTDAESINVILNLCEKTARNFRGKPDDIIVVKGARARLHNKEVKLNADWYTNLQINPNIPKAISWREYLENL